MNKFFTAVFERLRVNPSDLRYRPKSMMLKDIQYKSRRFSRDAD